MLIKLLMGVRFMCLYMGMQIGNSLFLEIALVLLFSFSFFVCCWCVELCGYFDMIHFSTFLIVMSILSFFLHWT